MNDTTLGIIAAAVPLIVIGFFALRRMPWIFAFFVALVAVGIGYLQTTDTMKEIGHKVRVMLPAGVIPEHKKAEEGAPAEGGVMKASPPPAETAPAAATPPATPPAAESTPPPAAPAPESTPPAPPASEPAPAATPPATPAPESTPDNSNTPPAAPAPAPSNP
jgi:outer membrane biosynthesis protein TonB